LLPTPPDTREKKKNENIFKSNGHAKFLPGETVEEHTTIANIL